MFKCEKPLDIPIVFMKRKRTLECRFIRVFRFRSDAIYPEAWKDFFLRKMEAM